MSDRKTFCAFGAYAVNVIDPGATVVMAVVEASEAAEVKESKLVTVNLLKRLGRAPWAEVVLDTMGVFADGSDKTATPVYHPPDLGIDVLTVGPIFSGQHLGGIYMLRQNFHDAVRPLFDPTFKKWPFPNLIPHTYQVMTSAVRADDGTVTRYHGFHAKVTADGGNSTKTLSIKGVTITIDLNDRTQCDDPAALVAEVQDPKNPQNIEKVLDATSKKDDEGAVFLSLKLAAKNSLRGPKEPPGGG